MSCYKFSLLFVSLFILTNVEAAKFTSEECLQSKFETEIQNSGQFFGLIKNELKIKKEACLIEVSFLKIKWLSDKVWKVDICREPIHLKILDKGSESFHKRIDNCSEKADNSFCVYWDELKDNLEDYGLIYAKGERESLETSHGKTYCSYLLLKKYLDEGKLFSKYDKPHSLFDEDIKSVIPKEDSAAPVQPLRPQVPNTEIGAEVFELQEDKPETQDNAGQETESKPRF